MTIRYVGPGGNDGNSGLTWALRKLTLNGVEDTPVAAGDTVYVGPGTYREQLTCDVWGTSGNAITYIGDVTGEHTDGVGGIVRITGSDDDVGGTGDRAYGIYAAARDYRTFRGFTVDLTTNSGMYIYNSDHCIIEDCYLGSVYSSSVDYGIQVDTMPSGAVFEIRRCVFYSSASLFLRRTSEATVSSSSIIENCLFLSGSANSSFGLRTDYVSGYTVKNCTFIGGYYAFYSNTVLTGTINVNNCIFHNCGYAIYGSQSGDISEDYNCISSNCTYSRNLTVTGFSSVAYIPLFEFPLLLDGIKIPWNPYSLSPASPVARRAGSSESSDDMYGITRPATSSKKSWGAIQYRPSIREITTVRSSAVSIALPDAGTHQIFVAVRAASTTISIYVYREASYAGTLPQMVIKEEGQSDRTTTDTGSASQWNQLTDTFTPQSTTDYIVLELVSNNTATSGSYAIYFDDLDVS